MTDSDKLACNKIIGDAVGIKPTESCRMGRPGTVVPVGCGERDKDSREYCRGKCSCWLVEYPDFCGDDAAAMEALKLWPYDWSLLRDSELDGSVFYRILLYDNHEMPILLQETQFAVEAPTIAATLKEAMIFQEEVEPEHEGGDTYLTKPRLKPALAVAIGGGGK